jgi:hypothetical protein
VIPAHAYRHAQGPAGVQEAEDVRIARPRILHADVTVQVVLVAELLANISAIRVRVGVAHQRNLVVVPRASRCGHVLRV